MSRGRESERPILVGGSMVRDGGIIYRWNLLGARKAL